MRIFSYIVVHDSGFAPNPFYGYCTLACCKPVIRRVAKEGHWIVGLSSKSERIVYAMRVQQKLTFEEYWNDRRFNAKRPDFKSSSRIRRRGDNIYKPLVNGEFRQLPSLHSQKSGEEDKARKRKDLDGKYVLVAEEFVYFGAGGPELPRDFDFIRVGRAHRSRFSNEQISVFAAWLEEQKMRRRWGRQGKPTEWGSDSCDVHD
jgi:hypothetical protein